MKKRLLRFPLFLLAFWLLVLPAAGEAEAERMEIQNQTYADNAFSCDVKLSGANMEGHVFAELFAESGQTKKVAEYPAKQTVQVKLTDTAPTDYVRVIWTDNAYTPIAEPETRRMPKNNSQAYADFEEALNRELRPDSLSASAGSNRLLVSCTEALNWKAFEGLDAVISGPNGHYVLQFETPAKANKCKEALESMPSVRYVEFDSAMIFEKETDTQEDTARTLSVEEVVSGRYLDSKDPADTADALSWGVERSGIDQYVAALKNKGINREIIVAVVDSGVDTHHEFLNGVLLDGHSSIPQNPSLQDEYEHGTHVAGIIADCTRGMNVKILPVRVLDKFGTAHPSTVANGICYAADHGADVINLSLGYSEHKQWIDDAIKYALEKKITVVVAACNFSTDASAFCPAHIEDCITVAALEQNEGNELQRWGKSNYGKAVDLSAAGGGVNSSMPDNQYFKDNGTSMAAPHVSSAAALLMCERGTSQTPSQIADALKNAAEPLTLDKPLGAGFLNMRPFCQNCQVTFQDDLTPPITASYGTSVALPSSASSKEGYEFSGWNTQADGGGKSYKAGEKLLLTENITLYPEWTPTTPENGAYALLYSDGELVFQNHNGANPDKVLLKTYPISLAESPAQHSRWYNERSNIRTAVFADSIRPHSTATWFYNCDSLSEILGLENLDVSLVTDMSQMFSGCTALTTLDLSALNASSTVNMQQMFFGCASLTTLNLSGWNTANVTNMADMFNGCSALETVRVSDGFKTDNVSNSIGMFEGCGSLVGGSGTEYHNAHANKEYARIDGGASAPGYFTDKNRRYPAVIEIETVSGIPGETVRVPVLITQNPGIAGALLDIRFDENLTLTNISRGDVLSAGTFDYDAGNGRVMWYHDQANVTETGVLLTLDFQVPSNAEGGMYVVSVALTDGLKGNLSDYDFNAVSVEVKPGAVQVVASATDNDIYAVLYGDGELVFQNNSRTESGRTVTDVYKVDEGYSYYQNAPWHEQRESITTVIFADTIKPQTTSYWFYQCWNLENIRGIEQIDTDNVTDMSGMFCICKSLTNLNVSAFNTANVTNMSYMFYACAGLANLDVSAFNTANVTSMDYMFYGCSGLTSLNVSGFDTANVTNMDSMFAQCSGLFTLDLSNFNTENVKSTCQMFDGCSGMTTLDISGFHTANVTNMGSMFNQCGQLMTIYASSLFVIDSESNSWCFMFDGCVSLVGGAGTTYQSNSIEKYHARIDGGPSAPGYFTDKNAPPDVLTLNYSDTTVYANDHSSLFVFSQDSVHHKTIIVDAGDTEQANYNINYYYSNAPGLQLKAYLNGTEIPASSVGWQAEKSYGYGNVDENGYVSSSSYDGFVTASVEPSIREQTITATLKSNPTVSASVRITFVYDAKIRFSIEDTSVATVDESGVVYGRSEGETTLSMTSDLTGQSASCKVSVGKRTTNAFDLVYKQGDQFYSLNSYGGPEYASVSATSDLYLKMAHYDDELTWGVKLDVGVLSSDYYDPEIFLVGWDNAIEIPGSGLYFPVSSVLKSYSGKILVYYQITLADGQILYSMGKENRNCFFLDLT